MEQSTLENILQEVVDALHHWLSYINTVAKSDVLLESSIRYALCEYLERRENTVCVTEVKHPHFPTRHFDFVWNRNITYSDNDNSKVSKAKIISDNESCCILECKYTKGLTNNSDERQRIFNDLCRLYYIKKANKELHALFLMAGNAEHFYNSFQKAQTRAKIIENTFSKDGYPQNINEQQNSEAEKFEDAPTSEAETPIYRASFYDWFKFDKGEIRTIESENPINVQNYKDFVNEYFPKKEGKISNCGKRRKPLKIDYEESIKFNTKLLAINGTLETLGEEKQKPCKFQTVAIWEILIDEQQ